MKRRTWKAIKIICGLAVAASLFIALYPRTYFSRLRESSPEKVLLLFKEIGAFREPIRAENVHAAYLYQHDGDAYVLQFDTELSPTEFAEKVLNVRADAILPAIYLPYMVDWIFGDNERGSHPVWWNSPDPLTVILNADYGGRGVARLIMASGTDGKNRVCVRFVKTASYYTVIQSEKPSFRQWTVYFGSSPSVPSRPNRNTTPNTNRAGKHSCIPGT